eukprot:741179-Hanusia_phi.AAC.1
MGDIVTPPSAACGSPSGTGGHWVTGPPLGGPDLGLAGILRAVLSSRRVLAASPEGVSSCRC